ncbi:tyrosine-type recombinase/integrase [Halopiger xanaduensis]|uniref:Integrase family protein n=1 Tax=Halopiger xanaduensis (strain DSM 18323 / JCM 14033 / SH-6) TaxID=797210 RepID=F8DET1_HALXS|nr:tyrosine-type recombinase/integrase [Halopiger xanaduensis]AEH39521.1 integrase family protein [Halopiger xanaduensis SH-6]
MSTNDRTSSEHIRWSHKSLEDLRSFWNKEIEPDLRRAGVDLDERPSYQDLLEVGYGGLQDALREQHDMTLGEFLESVGYFEADPEDSYPWGIDAETTVDELESYVRTLDRRRNLAESTVETKRSRLATYARCYRDVHGRADLVARLDDLEYRAEEIERVLAVFDELDRDLESDGSKLRYLGDVSQFYEHLQRRGKAAYNPAENIDMEYDWDRSEPDNPTLTSAQVRRLYEATQSPDEELLVIALCGWGLRRNEVAGLHVSQLVLEGDDPHIYFEERKNGPGTVALIYGRETLADRIDALGSTDREWSGYLFPSRQADSGHVVGETIQARFKRIAERAGVRVRGETPTSKMGRRFWYTTYLESQKQLLENLDAIAEDQGSSDASVVLKNYLSEAERRQYRREYMREKLAEAFGN